MDEPEINLEPDIELEPDEEMGDLAGATEKLKKLKADLKESQKERTEYLNGWQKERAEFMNYKKDESARMKILMERGAENIIDSILPAMDSFNMAFANKEAWAKVDANWRNGVEYIHQQFVTALADSGVSEIGKIGEIFDPSMHESIEQLPTEDQKQDHTIAEVIQKGYKMGERILRPARVKVYEYKERE